MGENRKAVNAILRKVAKKAERAKGKPQGWQPIETAPYDTEVLVWESWGSMSVAKQRMKTRGSVWISMGCEGPAIASQCDFGTTYQEPCPSHWQPLPEPPSGTSYADPPFACPPDEEAGR